MCHASGNPSGTALPRTEKFDSKPVKPDRFCGKCGRPLASGETTCRYCEKVAVKYCGKCGRPLASGETTCRFCEKDAVKFCGKCGRPLIGGETVCRSCGALVETRTVRRKKEVEYDRLRTVVRIGTIAAAAIVLLVAISTLTGLFMPSSGKPVLGITSNSGGEAYFEAPMSDHISEQAGVQYADNQLIVMAAANATKQTMESLFSKYSLTLIGQIESIGFFQVKTESSLSFSELNQLITALKGESTVEDAYLNTISNAALSAAPNDDWQGATWDENSPDGANWNMEAIRALTAWEYKNQISPVNVGVIDSAFEKQKDLTFAHIFQEGNAHEVENNGYRIHGNHVCGVIDAIFNNGIGVSGLAPNANIYAYSIEHPDADTQNQTGSVKSEGNVTNVSGSDMQMLTDLALLIEKDQVRVINISMGRSQASEMSSLYRTIGTGYVNAISRLIQKGNKFLIVVAAGNDGADASAGSVFAFISTENLNSGSLSSESIQAVKDRIIIVGAAENRGGGKYAAWWRSNTGDRVDIYAPGVSILSCGIDDDYISLDGTSMAAPHVTGAIALIWGANQSLSPAQVKDILLSTATKEVQNSESSNAHMLDAGAAVEKALGLVTQEGPSQETNDEAVPDNKATGEMLVQMKELTLSSAGDSLAADCYTIREKETTYSLSEVQQIIADGKLVLCELSNCRWMTKVYYVVDWDKSYRWVLFSENPNGDNCKIGTDGYPTDTYYDVETFQLARGDLMYNPQSTDIYYFRQISMMYPAFVYRTENETQIQIPGSTPVYYYDYYSGEEVYVETALEYYNQCANQDIHGARVGEVCWACGTQPFTITLQNGVATRIEYEATSSERFHVFSAPPASSGGIVGTWRTQWTNPDSSNLSYQTEFTFYPNGELLVCHISKLSGNNQIFSEGQEGTYTVSGSNIHITAFDSDWAGFVADAVFDSGADQVLFDGNVYDRAYTTVFGELAPN